ncbi:hypothetical protein HCJ76_43980 [Streptomyces sp. MC1]|uniref:hypothetical protein n=1 Tax=Streptomyces sp. MC1 TaxID=295105 RepID=UPI0018CBCF9D|nr:hypothetical protein [Streptomyces sp. MC1]MBG7704843.1 hypothetical protein [Streptomyces sp. MC1]
MTPADALRAHRNTTLLIACAVGALGALVGRATDGWGTAAIVAAVSGGGALFGGYMVRRSAVADMTVIEERGAVRGFADGLSHGVLAAVAKYESAVFPMTPGGVSPEERLARRTAAYHLASEDALPRAVRVAAAAALAALDEGGLRDAQDAVGKLFAAVHEQTARR